MARDGKGNKTDSLTHDHYNAFSWDGCAESDDGCDDGCAESDDGCDGYDDGCAESDDGCDEGCAESDDGCDGCDDGCAEGDDGVLMSYVYV